MKLKLSTAFKGLLVILVWKAYFSVHTVIRPLVMGSIATPEKLSNTSESFIIPELWESIFNNAIWIAIVITLIILWKEVNWLVKWIIKYIKEEMK